MLESLTLFADANAAAASLKVGIAPIFSALTLIAGALCAFFLVFGAYHYATSSGDPEKLERGKKTIRNALIGFVVVVAAASLVAVMQNAYTMKPAAPQQLPGVSVNEPQVTGVGRFVNAAVTAFAQGVIASVGESVINLIKQFTQSTPLLASNGSVFNLWVVMTAIADVLFLLVVALIGFRIMGASIIGLEDVDLNSLVPQAILAFILANLSIFAIDAIITLSNAMVQALLMGMSNDIVWTALLALITGASSMTNIGILLILLVVLILGIALLVYYLHRMLVLYVGAVLSPLIVLLWLLPSFRDFAIAAAKTYIVTIFVLFVQIVILMLAVSLFSGLVHGEGDPFITSLLGIATLSALLRTGHTMNQLAMIGIGGQGLRKLGNTFVRSVSHMSSTVRKGSNGVTVERVAMATAATGESSSSSTNSSRVLANTGTGKFAEPQTAPSQKLTATKQKQVSVERVASNALNPKDTTPDKEPNRTTDKMTATKNLRGTK